MDIRISNWDTIQKWLNASLLKLGSTEITLLLIFKISVSLIVVFVGAHALRRFLLRKFQGKKYDRLASIETFSNLIYYAILVICIFVVMDMAGFDLKTLAFLGGAIGVGIGFGLQNVASNFISGIIILFERPIKIGDRVEIGDVAGQVTSIAFRATTVLSNDNISMIVPNSEFISKSVVNWSHSDDIVRLRLPLGISYSHNPDSVIKIIQKIISEHPSVYHDRASDVLLTDFGESAVNLTVRVWTKDFSRTPGKLKSEIYLAIWKALKENNIEIPFPQRDLHIKSISPESSIQIKQRED